jgi:hypothetical protein
MTVLCVLMFRLLEGRREYIINIYHKKKGKELVTLKRVRVSTVAVDKQ